MKKKQRHLKTLYERFSHHKVENLELFKKNIYELLKNDFEKHNIDFKRNRTNKEWNVFVAIDKLNIQLSGTFYLSANFDKTGYSDAYCFSSIFEKINIKKTFSSKNERFLQVKVLASDFKDAILVIYEDKNISSLPFNIHIIRDKYSNFILQGNIAIDITNV